jgi:PAS domain S-box-containing protein
LQAIGDSVPESLYAKSVDGRVLYANREYSKVVGRDLSEIIGYHEHEWIKGNQFSSMKIRHDLAASGIVVRDDEEFTSPDGATRIYNTIKAPLDSSSGKRIGVVAISTDVTEKRAWEARERLLMREVDHRSKNLLASIEAMVHLTRAEDVASFKEAISERIQALSRSNSLLAESKWQGIELDELVRSQLEPYGSFDQGTWKISGPVVLLHSAAAQAFALILHELATNAAKHGALSGTFGQVTVSWSMLEKEGGSNWLEILWSENGGPLIKSAPVRQGFGSNLIPSVVEFQLCGFLKQEWLEGGLECSITLPLPSTVSS